MRAIGLAAPKVDPHNEKYLRQLLEMVESGEVTGFTVVGVHKPTEEMPERLTYWRSGLENRSKLIGDLYLLLNELANV